MTQLPRVGVRPLLATVVALALVAAACADSDSEPDADLTASTSSTTTAPADDQPDAGPAPLTATDVGVTADTIQIAAVYPDVSIIGNDSGDVEAKFRSVVDPINRAGGVHGRMIEIRVDLPVPIGVEYEATCVEHTEDEPVFAVIGLFFGEQVLCYSELHDTIAINLASVDEEQLERSTAPLLSVQPLSSRVASDNVAALLDSGDLEAGMRVALHGLLDDDALHETYETELEARGVDVVVSTLRTSPIDDPQAVVAEVEPYAARWVAEEVDAVVASSAPVAEDLLVQYERLGLEMPMLLPEGTDRPTSIITALYGVTSESFDHAVAVLHEHPPVDQFHADVNSVRDCVDAFEAVSGEVVELDAAAIAAGRVNFVPTVAACSLVELFVQVAEAAGPILTTESFGEAAAALGPVELTGMSAGSLGPGKPDVRDSPPLVARFDADFDGFRPIDSLD